MSIASMTGDHPIQIQRAQTTKDPAGGIRKDVWREVWTTRAAVQPMHARDRMIFAQRQMIVTHNVYFAGTADVRKNDRVILLDSPNPDDPRVFEIRGVMDEAGKGVLTRLVAMELSS